MILPQEASSYSYLFFLCFLYSLIMLPCMPCILNTLFVLTSFSFWTLCSCPQVDRELVQILRSQISLLGALSYSGGAVLIYIFFVYIFEHGGVLSHLYVQYFSLRLVDTYV